MSIVTEFVKAFLIPGSLVFLVWGLILGLILLHLRGRAAQWGLRWLTLLAALYWVLSMPFTAQLLLVGLNGGYGSVQDVDETREATAVVVLTGGAGTYRAGGKEIKTLPRISAFRTLEAARVYSLLGDPLVIVSGGLVGDELNAESENMREALIKIGVPSERILVETQSRNTREHAVQLEPLLKAHRIKRFVLVTSPSEMWRAKATLEAAGLDPVPSVTEEWGEQRWGVLPTSTALRLSRSALLGYMGLIYYWVRGWI